MNVKAGKAKIAKTPTALEQLEKDPFEDLDSSKFEVGYEEDLSSPVIRKFTDTDINLGIDSNLGFADDDKTSISTLVGSGRLKLKDETEIKDSISNIILSGALAKQAQDGVTGSGTTGSSGAAVGASVNVSEFSRSVQALIKDGADITLAESLNVVADSMTQSLNIAIAGAFAGGINMQKEPGFIDNKKTQLKNKADGYLTKLKGVLSNVSDSLGKADDSPKETGKLDEKGNPILSYKGKEYKTDLNSQYYSSDGEVLKDSQGNPVKANNSLNGKDNGLALGGSANKNGSGKNMSAALAGSVNLQINDATVAAEIGNAKITVEKDVNVSANQTTKALNVGGGIAKATTVGAGAAVNLVQNTNKTNAKLSGADIKFKGNSKNNLLVKAEENNDNVQVAIGVGAATNDPNNALKLSVAAGGSFNTDVLKNEVVASVENSTIENADQNNTISVDVDAENHSTSYKGAGGFSVNTGVKTTNVGAGMGGNLNLINKTTNASVDNTSIKNAKNVSVAANKDKNKKTENLISVGMGGSVVTGGKAAYTFFGAMGTDVIRNSIIAEIVNNSEISADNAVNVIANNYVSNGNITGALGFSGASKGAGVGIGSVFNVLNNDVTATVANSVVKAKTVDVASYNKEDLKFLAVNMGIQKGGSSVDVNGIVNVVKNNISASIFDSEIVAAGDVNVDSIYEASIKGITGAGAVSAGSGLAFGANVLSNSLLSDNQAFVKGSDIKTDGKLSVKADTTDDIEVNPIAAAVTNSGAAAAAANIGVNVVSNSTKAYVDKSAQNSKISANGIDTNAVDTTNIINRGGTVAVNGSGSVAVGGSISADIVTKDVASYIDNALISNGGDINVASTVKNIFGAEDPMPITISSLTSSITDQTYDVSQAVDLLKWNMSYDIAGSNTAAVSGTIISKTVSNDVNSYIGANTVIEKAGNIDVTALNKTNASAVIGNVSVGGQAAVGASIFSNVNASNVNAGIKSGAKIGTVSEVGDINIAAESVQDYHSINFVVGASSNAAVSGSVNTNIVVNETNAFIEKGAEINSNGGLNVTADDSMNIENLQLAVAGSGAAAVGAIGNINVLNNKVNAIIGKNSDSDTNKSGQITLGKDVNVSASSSEDYQANVLMVAGSGTAAVGGIVVSNTMATEVNSGIEEITLRSNGGKINVKAENAFNKKHKNQTTGIANLVDKESLSTDDLTAADMIPLVSILNIAGSGTAAVNGTVVDNNVITSVDAYVRNADVSSSGGLNVNANSSMTTYDAVMGVAGSGLVAVGSTGVINVYSGSTTAEIANSVINGSASLNAADEFSLNTVIFNVAGAGAVAVSPVINSNTLVNNVIARITDSTIKNASTVDVISKNQLAINDIIAAGAISGTGASINAVPVTNVFVGDTSSYITGSTIDGAKTIVKSENDIDTISMVLGVAGSGVGADVSGYVLTNVFDNDLNAYIDNSVLTNAKATSVNAESDLNMNGIIVSGGVTGVGASVTLNAITNVIKNNINSEIRNSSITGGSVAVNGKQNSYISSNTTAVNATGVGDSTSVNAITNVFKNNINSFLTNTDIKNASTIYVTASSIEDINNINMGASASGVAANSANSIVNVLENNTNAKIHAGNKSIQSSGKLSVNSTDELKLSNSMGMFTGSGFEAAGANINVNVINNAVKAELLSNSSGSIIAKTVDVAANSTISLKEVMTSASLGLAGISGNVIVNSIGGKFSDNDSNLADAKLTDTLGKTDSNYDKTSGKIAYTKNGEEKSLENEYSLTTGTNKEGTVANINANVTAKGTASNNKNAIKVSASNVVKGYNSDKFSITNAIASGGKYAAGASVLVNAMQYKTSAGISGGNVTAEKGNIDVLANSTIKASIDTIQATIGAAAIGGNVGYFNNKSATLAEIANATINGKGVNVNANSLDEIALNIVSGSVGGIDANLSIALNSTSNTVKSLISGSNVNIVADTVDVIAANNSTLKSQLDSLQIGGASFGVVLNRTKSNAITQAIANATGSIKTDGLNFIAKSNGINAETTMNIGNISGLSLSYTDQGAFVESEFRAGIDNSSLVVENSGTTNILSGVKDINEDGEYEAAVMNAKVITKRSSIALGEGSVTSLNAGVNAQTEAVLNAKHSSNGLNIASKLKRTADVGSTSASIGAISLSHLNMKSSTKGSNTITINGDNKIAGKVSVDLNDESKVSTEMIDASLKLLGGESNVSTAEIDTDTEINIGGKLNANEVAVGQTVKRTSFNTAESDGAGLITVDKYKLETSSKGKSIVNISADMTDTNYKNALSVNSNATNQAESILSANKYALAAISKDVSSNTLDAKNTVNLKNAKVKSKGNVSINASSKNKATMKKDVSGSGAVIVFGGQLDNNITSSADIIADNSKISAKNISLSSAADLGTVDNKNIEYTIGIKGANVRDNTTINNNVTQSANINIKKSEINAEENLASNVKTTSTFKQKIASDGGGFVSKNVAESNLTVTNNNNFSVDKNSKLYGNKVDIALDSSNTLESKVDIDVSHFGGRDPEGYSYITLNVNNKLDNKGSIKAGELAQIDLMKNSRNNLTQDTKVVVEAAVATANAGGSLKYNVKNDVNIAKDADISSGKDVVMNYSSGNNNLKSNIYSKKTSRLLFGIPIVKKKQYSSVEQTTQNSLQLDGEVVAGSSSKRYMKIDKDGNIDMKSIQGFVEGDYKVVDAVSMSGEELTAETIADLQDKITELKAKVNALKEDSSNYQADINEYNAQITALTKIYNEIKSKSTITQDEVAADMKTNIKNTIVLGSEETNDSKISEDVFNRIYEGMKDTDKDLKTYLDGFVVTPAEGDNAEVKLSDNQKTLIMNTYQSESAKIKDFADGGYSTYGDKIIADAGEFNTIKNNLQSSINSLTSAKNNLQSSIDNINSSLTTINSNIDSYNSQITYLRNNPLADVNIDHSSIEFGNLVVLPSKIDLNGISNTDIKGKGNFKTYMPNLTVDNYSSRNLVFKNIDLMTSGSAGLNINGRNYSNYANTLKQVNHANAFDSTPDTAIGSSVHFISENDASKANNVTINTFFDSLNPALSLAEAISSDITFGGYIAASNKLNVLNENGDISFNNLINTGSKDITSTQGNITFNSTGSDLELKAGDRMVAGKDITVNAKNITIDGTMQAGYDDRNLVITDNMLNNLVVDPTTGERNMVNLGTTDKSAYLEGANNIKVIYKDGKLLVFNTKQEGGNVKLTGNVKGNGTVKYTNGYSDVSITNNTNKELIINNLENNRMNGTFTNRGTVANVIRQGKEKASSTITSNGKVTVAGIVKNGKGKLNGDSVSEFNISSADGIVIANSISATGVNIPTIDSIGDINISNAAKNITFDGIINNESGNITVSNSGQDVLFNSLVKNTNGNISVTNTNGIIKLVDNAEIQNANGNVSLVNNGTTTEIAGVISNTIGNVTVSNTGSGELLVSGNVENGEGNVEIAKAGIAGVTISGNVVNKKGNTTVTNDGSGKVLVSGNVSNKGGLLKLTNNGENGTEVTGLIENENGNIEIANNKGDFILAESGKIELNKNNTSFTNDITVSNADGAKKQGIFGWIKNFWKGNTKVENKGEVTEIAGVISNTKGDVTVSNTGSGELLVSGNVENGEGNVEIAKAGTAGVTISGNVVNKKGSTKVANQGSTKTEISGLVENGNGNLEITKSGIEGITISGDVLNKQGKTAITNDGSDKIFVSGNVTNNNGQLDVINNGGENGVEVTGKINNKKGVTNIKNTNDQGGIKVAVSGIVKNEDGNINIANNGSKGIIVEGIINAVNKDIQINNSNSDIVIGEYDSDNDNYIKTDNGNVIISQINGNIINGISDIDSAVNQNHDRGNVDKAYKTLISSAGNLTIDVEGGNIGSDTHALANKESGFGINASTRDYTESLNVNVKGKVNAKAKNNGNALINIRAKESDLKVDNITSDGNVMLTAADWKQADENPARTDSEYLNGYSIINAASDNSKPNVEGRNISVIASNNVGSANKSFTYNQLENGSVSVMAENDIFLAGKGKQDNIWQLISKNGSIDMDLTGNASIREITAAKTLKLISKAHDLTIYDLGKISNALSADDILFPHDGIDISGIVPETIEIQVLDTNSETQDSLKGNSTLNIFNAYVRGNDSTKSDVILKADNIIAHAYDASSSSISNVKRPKGFNAKDGRTYSNDYTDSSVSKDLKATGFNTVGDGGKLSFEITGVSPNDVVNAGVSKDVRNYSKQNQINGGRDFKNPNGFKDTIYKAKDVTLSLNSSKDNAPTENRGLKIDKIYADNAYVDTKDLNLEVKDGFITNYGEFRNGNRGGAKGGNFVSEDYRWAAIIDNDYNRNLLNLFEKTPVTLEMFTKKTGSFGLSLGETLTAKTYAPIVAYDHDSNVILPRNENSFYRLTYKDNKIQVKTTEPDFEELQDAQLHPKREFLRFAVLDENDGIVKVVDKKYPARNRILSLENISSGGLFVVHDGTMKEKEKFFVDISYGDIQVTTEVEVVRLTNNNRAGLRFINMDKATANKILYMNMAIEENAAPKVKVSQTL